MQRLVEILAKALVDNPDEVRIEPIDRGDSLVIEIRVAPEDMGKVIGKQGRIVRAIRTLTKAAAVRQGKRVSVEVV